MASNERLADNIIDIVQNGGVDPDKLRVIFTDNVLFEQLFTLSADLEVAWNKKCASENKSGSPVGEDARTDALFEKLRWSLEIANARHAEVAAEQAEAAREDEAAAHFVDSVKNEDRPGLAVL